MSVDDNWFKMNKNMVNPDTLVNLKNKKAPSQIIIIVINLFIFVDDEIFTVP